MESGERLDYYVPVIANAVTEEIRVAQNKLRRFSSAQTQEPDRGCAVFSKEQSSSIIEISIHETAVDPRTKSKSFAMRVARYALGSVFSIVTFIFDCFR